MNVCTRWNVISQHMIWDIFATTSDNYDCMYTNNVLLC